MRLTAMRGISASLPGLSVSSGETLLNPVQGFFDTTVNRSTSKEDEHAR